MMMRYTPYQTYDPIFETFHLLILSFQDFKEAFNESTTDKNYNRNVNKLSIKCKIVPPITYTSRFKYNPQ